MFSTLFNVNVLVHLVELFLKQEQVLLLHLINVRLLTFNLYFMQNINN